MITRVCLLFFSILPRRTRPGAIPRRGRSFTSERKNESEIRLDESAAKAVAKLWTFICKLVHIMTLYLIPCYAILYSSRNDVLSYQQE